MNRYVIAFFDSAIAADQVLPKLQGLGLSPQDMHIYAPDEVLGRSGELLPEGPGASTHLPDALFAGMRNLLADVGLVKHGREQPVSAEEAAPEASLAPGTHQGGVVLAVAVDDGRVDQIRALLREAGGTPLDTSGLA